MRFNNRDHSNMRDDLNDLKHRIQEKMPLLTKRQKDIADYIVENPEKFALSSIRDVEANLGISKATIVRLTQVLGYKGFQELRSAFLNCLRRELDPLPRYKAFLSEDVAASEPLTLKYLRSIADEAVNNIHRTLQLMDEAQYAKCIQLLKNAPHVYTMGLGLSSYLAENAAYLLNRVSINAQFMSFSGLTFAEKIINLSRKDVILAFCFPSYSVSTIKAAKYARTRKIKVVSVTDKVTSDIVPYSDIHLTVSVESRSISNSVAPVLVLIQSIATQIGYEMKSRMLTTLEAFEHVRTGRFEKSDEPMNT